MPWPFLPPNPDTLPAPHDGDLFVFGLTLTGMRPYDEQADHAFQVDGVRAAVYVPIVKNATSFQYAGVGMAPLTRVGTTATYKGTYVPLSKSNAHSIEVDARKLTGAITSVSVARSGTLAVFSVAAQAAGSGFSVVVSPYLPQAPRFSNQEAYAMAGGREVLPSGGGLVKVAVTPGAVSQYAVYVARGLPSTIEPASSGKLIKI